MNQYTVHILAGVVLSLTIGVFVLFVLGRVSTFTFWTFIALAALSAYVVLPRIAKRDK